MGRRKPRSTSPQRHQASLPRRRPPTNCHSPAGATTFVKFDTFDIDYNHTMMYLDPKDANTDGQLQ